MYKFRLINLTLSDEDEAMERKAINEAKKFMENYGKGRQPYVVDLSHYLNTSTPASIAATAKKGENDD